MNLYPEESAKAAQRDEAQRIAAQHRSEAVRLLMDSPSGRIFVRELLAFCHVFADPILASNEQLQFQQGLRRAGMYVFKALAEENPTHITTLFKEDKQ